MLLLTLRGTPFLFQGDELGLQDVEVPPDRVVDVDGRDPVRAPIPWDPPSAAGPGAGFTTGDAVAADHPRCRAPGRVGPGPRPRIHALAAPRAAGIAARPPPRCARASYRPLDAGQDVFAYVRGESVAIALNFASEARRADASGRGTLLLSTRPTAPIGAEVDLATLELAADEGVIVALR